MLVDPANARLAAQSWKGAVSFVPSLPPAPLTGSVVVEGKYEALTALVCQPHQLVGNGRSCAPNNRPSIAATGVDRPLAQRVDGRFDCNNDFRFVEMADREPGGELVSKVGTKGGLVPCVSQSRSLDLTVLGPVEEDDAWIRAVIVGGVTSRGSPTACRKLACLNS